MSDDTTTRPEQSSAYRPPKLRPYRVGFLSGLLLTMFVGLYAAVTSAAPANGGGDLDPTFDGDGIVTTTIGLSDLGTAVAIQDDGKIVVVGSSDFAFVVTRYYTDGSLDTSFSGDGITQTSIELANQALGVDIQSDGKIVVAGFSAQGVFDNKFALARYEPNGDLDASFGISGVLTNTVGDISQGFDVKVQQDGKIVVIGGGGSFSTGAGPIVVRYETDGNLDPTFGLNGVVTTVVGTIGAGTAGALQDDGKIVVAGNTDNKLIALRYEMSGTLDTSFSSDGVVTAPISTESGAFDVAIQPDGKIVVVGRSGPPGLGSSFLVIRYNTDGALDPSFGVSGVLTTPIGTNSQANGVRIQPDGKIVVAGNSSNSTMDSTFALARYDKYGDLDVTFAMSGVLTTPIGVNSVGWDVALQADGKIVVPGVTGQGSLTDIAVARYERGPLEYKLYLPMVLKN